jgi:AsmA protein
MKKFLKILAWVVGGIVALLIVAILVLPLVFDPNDYKDEVIRVVKTETGRDLKIEGKIGWSLFPRLGISTGALQLSNAPGFGQEPFARVEATTASVELLPLLRREVRIGTVVIDGLTLNLAKNAAGKTNWDDLTQPKGQKPTTTAPKEKSGGGVPLPAGGKLDIRRSTVTWRDLGTGDKYAVRNLSLQTGELVVNAPIDTNLALDLEYGTPPKKAALRMNAKTLYSENKLALKPFELKIDESRLAGFVEIVNLSNPAYRFDLALDQIDLDRYLPPAQKGAAKPATPGSAAGAAVEIPIGLLRALDLQGKFAIGKLKAFGIRSDDVRTQVSATKGLLQFGPNSAKLYGGTYGGRTVMDVRTNTPQFKFEEQLQKVQLGPFLKDAGVFDKFSGEAELKLVLSASGGDADRIKRTLNGNVSVAARDGKIEGVDLSKIVTEARRLYDKARGKNVTVQAAPTDETAFKSLRASANVVNGVATTNDLKLEGPVVRADGGGSADLGKETLNYRIRVTLAEAADRKGTTVPVLIGGTFAAPTYGVDFGEVLKQEAGKKIDEKKKEAVDKLEQRLKDRLKRR